MDWLTTSLQKVGLDIVPLKLSSSFSNIKVKKIWTKRFLRFCPLTTSRLNLILLFHQLLIMRGTSRKLQNPFRRIWFLYRYIWKYIIKIKYTINCFWLYLYPLRNKNCHLNQIATHFFRIPRKAYNILNIHRVSHWFSFETIYWEYNCQKVHISPHKFWGKPKLINITFIISLNKVQWFDE